MLRLNQIARRPHQSRHIPLWSSAHEGPDTTVEAHNAKNVIDGNKFVVDIATPGFDDEILHEGFSTESETVVVIVPDVADHETAHTTEMGLTNEPDSKNPACQRSWQIPLKHVSSVPFFEAAFRKDGFLEGETKTITLTEEHACAFEMFITWLYRGLAIGEGSSYKLIDWTCFYLMVEKWCLKDLARNVLCQMANMMSCAEVNSSCLHDWIMCYRLLEDHDARYLAVNSIVVAMPIVDMSMYMPTFEKTNFNADFVRWSRIALFKDTCNQDYPVDADNEEEALNRIPRFLAETLMPILYSDWPWPEKLEDAFERSVSHAELGPIETREHVRRILAMGEHEFLPETSNELPG